MNTKITSEFSQLSSEECVWKLGRVLGFAALESARGGARGRVAASFHEALLLGLRLEVKVPALPVLLGDQRADEVAAVRYLLHEAGAALAEALHKNFGSTHRGLLEGSIKLQILYLGYQPEAQITLALREALTRAFQEAELPERVWKTLDARIKEGAPGEALRLEVERTERAIWTHLLSEEPAPVSRETALASWELGRALGNAVVCYALRLSEAAVRGMRIVVSDQLERLSIRRAPPVFPEPGGDNSAALLWYVKEAQRTLGATLLARFNEAHRALFVTALLTQVMSFLAASEEARALLTESLAQTGITPEQWRASLERVQRGATPDEVHASIKKIEDALSAVLSAPPPAAPVQAPLPPAPKKKPAVPVSLVSSAPPKKDLPPASVSYALASWELGLQLASAVLFPLQEKTPSGVSATRLAVLVERELGLVLPPFPVRTEDKAADAAAAFSYLLKTGGGPLADRLEKRFGASSSALFLISLRLTLLIWLYAPYDTWGQTILSSVIRMAPVASLPESLFAKVRERVHAGATLAEVKAEVLEMINTVESHLSRPRASLRGGGASAAVRFERYASSLYVKARLSERVEATLVYDTGATYTCIDEALAAELGLVLVGARYVEVSTANGVVCRPLASLQFIEVGGARVEGPLDVVVLEAQPADTARGLLGLNFLRSFITEVDLERGTVSFRLREG